VNWLDWAIVFVVGLGAVNGLRRGFVLTLTRLVSLVGALVAAFVLTKPAVAILETRFGFATSLSQTIARWVRLPADFAVTRVSELSAGQLGAMLERSGLPEQYQDAVVTWIAEAPGQAAVSLARFIHQGLALLLLNVITFVVLLGLARWVISLFGKGVASAVHHVGAGPLDHLGGLGLGAAQGLLFACIALGLLLPVLATGTLVGIQDAVGESRFAAPLLSGFYIVSPWLRQIGTTIWERIT
jgi:uncharacterized membrane protein required for colicin V production